MNEAQMLQLVEHYSRKVSEEDGKIKVTRISEWKTVFIEKNDGVGRSIVMTEYKVDGIIYWAGYSSDSQTVYISLAARGQ
jgi:ABC-type lipoprotein release transport system permease subunit